MTNNSETRPKPDADRDVQLLDIAARNFCLETFEIRNADSLDFREAAVWSIRAALEAAGCLRAFHLLPGRVMRSMIPRGRLHPLP
jgi:hypothetical protein